VTRIVNTVPGGKTLRRS